jgi:hypothetical protein
MKMNHKNLITHFSLHPVQISSFAFLIEISCFSCTLLFMQMKLDNKS